MSIYGSGLVSFDADYHTWETNRCAKWKPGTSDHWDMVVGSSDYYLLDPATACTCRCGPIAYQGSHVLPSDEDPRIGFVDLSTIAGFIGREDRPALDEDADPDPFWPWLRLSVGDRENDATVVLDAAQAREVRDQLTWWIERTEPAGEEQAA